GHIIFSAGAVDVVKAAWFNTAEAGGAINAAVYSIKDIGGEIRLPSGSLTQTVGVNLTNIGGTAVSIDIKGDQRGTIITCAITGGNCFDLTGSKFMNLWNFTISGDGTDVPAIGFLLARNSTHDSAGPIHMHSVHTLGTFSKGAYYNYASEEFRAYDCYFTNDYAGPVVVVTRTNISSAASAYATIDTGSV